MSRESAQSVCTNDDVTLPLDKFGLVVFFRIKSHPFFFNGHTGFFCDSLPEYAERIFTALGFPEKERREEWDRLKERFGPECQSLLKEIDLFQRGIHPDLKPERRQERFLSGMNPPNIVIYVSQSCNFSCAYCVNQRGTFGHPASFMSPECANDVLRFVREIVESDTHRTMTVSLFGGEPLLNLKAVYILARGIQDLNHSHRGTRIHLILSTNGTIYSREIFDVFAERPELSTVSVSFDAFKDIQDRNRPFLGSKRSSYDCVLGNIQRMMHEGIPCCVSCVVTDSLDYVAAAKELHRLGINCLMMRPLSRHIFGTSRFPDVFKEEFADWKRKYLEYTDFHLDYLMRSNPVEHVDRSFLVEGYIKNLAGTGGVPYGLSCGSGDTVISIDSEGKIFPCTGFLGRKELCLGEVKKGFDKRKYSAFANWLLSNGQHRIDHERCRNCFAKRFCGGGCYGRSFDVGGDLRPLNESQCRYIRERVKIDLYYLSQVNRRGQQIQTPLTDMDA
jgi:uncharacterized protein